MNDSRSIRFHYLLRAVILLAFALYIGHLVQQDALHYYVAPKLARWVQLCPIPLTLMALSLAVQALFGKGSVLCDCEHRLPHSFSKVQRYMDYSFFHCCSDFSFRIALWEVWPLLKKESPYPPCPLKLKIPRDSSPLILTMRSLPSWPRSFMHNLWSQFIQRFSPKP